MLSHVTLGTNDFARARAFYDPVLATLGLSCQHAEDQALAYGRGAKEMPRLWILVPFDGEAASVGNGSHIAFLAETREQVRAFHAAALEQGGSDEGAPGPRPQYSETYYGAYVRDPDGNKLQAVCYAPG